ncbi:MAG: transcriptional regulator [Bacteroidota bacterium]|nr:transcriptional regulator [Bacteroidota bacterium]
MQNFYLDKEIIVFFITAKSFPDGVLEAHEKMHSYVSYNDCRKCFGISAPDKSGKIIYKSAAEELDKGEFSKHNLDTFIIKKGNYIFINIKNFMKDISSIGKAFQTLLSHPTIDPTGCCVEWYMGREDVRCMVRLKD